MTPNKGKIKAYAFIVDKNGMPRIDNPLSVPNEAWETLTQTEKDWANSHCPVEFKRNK
jgi:hypothetical protein